MCHALVKTKQPNQNFRLIAKIQNCKNTYCWHSCVPLAMATLASVEAKLN